MYKTLGSPKTFLIDQEDPGSIPPLAWDFPLIEKYSTVYTVIEAEVSELRHAVLKENGEHKMFVENN